MIPARNLIFMNMLVGDKEIKRIECSSLSNLDKHHVRLVAYCISSFRQMISAETKMTEEIPSIDIQRRWCLQHPVLSEDANFVDQLLEQFKVVSVYIEEIANSLGKAPLSLNLEDLITFTEFSTTKQSNVKNIQKQ